MLVQQVGYALGAILGSVCMFSNGAYAKVLSGTDYYRPVELSPAGLLQRVWTNFLEDIYPNLYMNNWFINGVLLAACICIYSALTKDEKTPPRRQRALKIGLRIQLVYVPYSIFSTLYLGLTEKLPGLMLLDGLLTVISGIALLYFLTAAALRYQVTEKFLFIMGSILFLCATLLVVTPIGPRCFFITYVLFILLLMEVLKLPPVQTAFSSKRKPLAEICQAVVLTALIFYFSIFSAIYRVDRDRVFNARQMADEGEKTIEIQDLPYRSFVYNSVPCEETNLAERFKLFYGFPQDIYLVTVDQNGVPVPPPWSVLMH